MQRITHKAFLSQAYPKQRHIESILESTAALLKTAVEAPLPYRKRRTIYHGQINIAGI